MAAPQMFIVAGPPGAGKSSLFPTSKFPDRVFNADDRAAPLNGGSYEDIPISIRTVVNREFEEFVHTNIRAGVSFALESTLRSSITFEQARLARDGDPTFVLEARAGRITRIAENFPEWLRTPLGWTEKTFNVAGMNCNTDPEPAS